MLAWGDGVRCVHLGVEEAGGRLNDADGLIVDRDGVEGALGILQDGDELQTQILGVQLGAERVGHRLLGAGRDLNRVALRSEVADDLRLAGGFLDERATDNGDANGSGLVVCDGETGLGGVAIDELHAKDLRLRERDRDGDLKVGRLRFLMCL